MNKPLIIGAVIIVIVGAAWFLVPRTYVDVLQPEPEQVGCTMEAKICPDGSAVGRSGPKCEFAACPSPSATSTTLTTYLGGTVTGMNVSINPREVVSDSRCPTGVQCIWAGEVTVRTALSTQVSHGEHVLKLGEPQVFGDYDVTLVAVTPTPVPDQKIPDSSYRFTFEVIKR